MILMKCYNVLVIVTVFCPQERCPPLIEDFLYICDDAYNRKQFIEMEQLVLKAVDFDLGIPLSYRFLRRYAKVKASIGIPLLILSEGSCSVSTKPFLT